jgi:GPI ethanolamine phosphate transferase 2/3 subunit F
MYLPQPRSHTLETYALALLCAILTTLVPAYVFAVKTSLSAPQHVNDRYTYIRLFAELEYVQWFTKKHLTDYSRTSTRSHIERAVLYPCIGALIGAWLGAIPIALDWDRPWQVIIKMINFVISHW